MVVVSLVSSDPYMLELRFKGFYGKMFEKSGAPPELFAFTVLKPFGAKNGDFITEEVLK